MRAAGIKKIQFFCTTAKCSGVTCNQSVALSSCVAALHLISMPSLQIGDKPHNNRLLAHIQCKTPT